MKILTVITLALCLLSPTNAPASQKGERAMAPFPSAITQASTIFILNVGGSDSTYDEFYTKMKDWGRYELVDSPEKAQLVFEISYGSQGEGPQVYTNPANLRTYSYTINRIKLAVVDPVTKKAIWTTIQTPEGARLEKNREKNLVRAVSQLVETLKKRITITAAKRTPRSF